jgi:hypothetical protein
LGLFGREAPWRSIEEGLNQSIGPERLAPNRGLVGIGKQALDRCKTIFLRGSHALEQVHFWVHQGEVGSKLGHGGAVLLMKRKSGNVG